MGKRTYQGQFLDHLPGGTVIWDSLVVTWGISGVSGRGESEGGEVATCKGWWARIRGPGAVLTASSSVHSGCSDKTHSLAGLRTIEMRCSQFWRLEVQDRGQVRDLFQVTDFSLCLHMVKRAREISGTTFIGALILFTSAPPSQPNHNSKASPPTSISLGISKYKFWEGTQTFRLQPSEQKLPLKIKKIGMFILKPSILTQETSFI